MLNCPRCGIPAERRVHGDGLIWHCPQCGGASTIISLMRKYVPDAVVNSLWQAAKKNQVHTMSCPSCNQKLVEIPVLGASFVIDVCPCCAFVWFDSGEYQLLPKTPPASPEKQLPLEAAQLLALRRIEELSLQVREEKTLPDEEWKYIPALLGVPVEFDEEPVSCVPYVTWSLTGIIIAVSILGFLDILPIEKFGLIPAQWGRMGGITFFTSFFLHGSMFHLLGNLYFLFAFGDNVEDVLGRWRFVFLLAVSTLAGGIAHVLTNPGSTVVCIGASGGISGLVAYYALRFPKYRIGFFLSRYWWFGGQLMSWFRFPVTVFLGFWIFLQFIGVACGLKEVAYMAHLGGLLAGTGYWLLQRWLFSRRLIRKGTG